MGSKFHIRFNFVTAVPNVVWYRTDILQNVFYYRQNHWGYTRYVSDVLEENIFRWNLNQQLSSIKWLLTLLSNVSKSFIALEMRRCNLFLAILKY